MSHTFIVDPEKLLQFIKPSIGNNNTVPPIYFINMQNYKAAEYFKKNKKNPIVIHNFISKLFPSGDTSKLLKITEVKDDLKIISLTANFNNANYRSDDEKTHLTLLSSAVLYYAHPLPKFPYQQIMAIPNSDNVLIVGGLGVSTNDGLYMIFRLLTGIFVAYRYDMEKYHKIVIAISDVDDYDLAKQIFISYYPGTLIEMDGYGKETVFGRNDTNNVINNPIHIPTTEENITGQSGNIDSDYAVVEQEHDIVLHPTYDEYNNEQEYEQENKQKNDYPSARNMHKLCKFNKYNTFNSPAFVLLYILIVLFIIGIFVFVTLLKHTV